MGLEWGGWLGSVCTALVALRIRERRMACCYDESELFVAFCR